MELVSHPLEHTNHPVHERDNGHDNNLYFSSALPSEPRTFFESFSPSKVTAEIHIMVSVEDADLCALGRRVSLMRFPLAEINDGQGSPQFFIQREYYKPTFSFGLRWDLGREK